MKADYTNAEGDENFINTKVATTPINININLACSIVPIVPIWISITYVRNQSNIRKELKTYCPTNKNKFKNRIKNLQECDHHNCRELSQFLYPAQR